MRTRSLLASAAAALLAGPSLVSAQTDFPAPQPCTGDCFAHDPSIVKRGDGTYFQFNTLDLLSIRTAPSLNGPWTVVGSVLDSPSIINMTGNDVLWAPDVSFLRGLYYCVYSVSVSGSQTSAIGYATSATMDPGSWTDHGQLLASSPDTTPYNAIDPNLSVVPGDTAADDEQLFLLWGSYWQDIYQTAATLSSDGSLLTAAVEEAAQIAYNAPEDGRYMEGAFLYPHDGSYFLFLSVGRCCTYGTNTTPPAVGTPYHVNVCRGDSPTGPFYGKLGKACLEGGGTTILASHDDVYAPGGQGVFYDADLGDVFYYHYLNTSIGLQYANAKLGWNVLQWGEDGWPSLPV